MEMFYAHQLTFEQCKQEAAKGSAITTVTGHLIVSKDRQATEKELWAAYRAEIVNAMKHDITLSPEVISSNNEILIPQINNGTTVPAPVARPSEPAVAAAPPVCNAKGKPFTWSFSAISDFENCPMAYAAKRFYFSHKDGESEHLRYGNYVHKAMEDRLLKKTPLPADLAAHERFCAALENAPGDLTAEVEMCLTKDLRPTGWFSKDACGRGKTDVDILQGNQMNIYDWKTGKEKDNPFQLEVFAAFKSIYYPEVEMFVPKFIWLKTGNVTPKTQVITKAQIPGIWDKINDKLHRMQQAWEYENFPARPSGLCGWCPVAADCSHRR